MKIEEGKLQVDYLKVSMPSVFEEPFCLRSVVKHMLAYETVQYIRRNGVPYPLELSVKENSNTLFRTFKDVDIKSIRGNLTTR